MNQSVRPVVLVRLASVDRRKERSFESLRSSYVEKHELLTFFPAVCPFDRQSTRTRQRSVDVVTPPRQEWSG